MEPAKRVSARPAMGPGCSTRGLGRAQGSDDAASGQRIGQPELRTRIGGQEFIGNQVLHVHSVFLNAQYTPVTRIEQAKPRWCL
jgi:hypothetical protein